MPVARELHEWAQRMRSIRRSRRAHFSLAIALMLAVGVFLPLDMHVDSQGMLRPARSFEIYAPVASIVRIAPPPHGSQVTAGTPLVQLASPETERHAALAESRRTRVVAQLRTASLDDVFQADLPVLRERLPSIDAEISGIALEEAHLQPTAPFDGIVVDSSPELRAGDTVTRNEHLTTLVDLSTWEVRTYLGERDLSRVPVGASAWFYPEPAGRQPVELVVTRIDPDVSRTLAEPLLGSTHGGVVPVHSSRETLMPERAIYGVSLRMKDPGSVPSLQQMRGRVVIRAQARTLLKEYFETAAAVVVRESGW